MISHRADRRELNAASPLQIYLHDINDTPLLSAEEERELAFLGGRVHGALSRGQA